MQRRTLRGLLLASILGCCCLTALAQAAGGVSPYSFDPQRRIFRIDAGGSTYAFGVNKCDELETIYWGGRLQPTDPLVIEEAPEVLPFEAPTATVEQEYGGWGGGMYVEPALKIAFADGSRDLVLHYLSHTIAPDGISIVLKDILRNVLVTLHYTADPATGVIGRSATIRNGTDAPFTIEQAAAGSLNLPVGEHFQLHYLTGRWASEFQLQQREIVPGKIVLESRRGSTGQQNNPWVAIERSNSSDEDRGDVWFGALAWSGSWSMVVEQDQVHRIRVVSGFNPFDFGYKLAPGEELRTPVLYGGFTEGGMGEASRLLHRFERAHVLPGAPTPKLRPVIYNSWEATHFHIDEVNQIALAEKAASLGVERFVIDDGWFGSRDNDHSGLGDWRVNMKKFPHGLKPLIDKVHTLGMDFGIWVEPEMVNPDSDLYRAHPDWVLNFTGRPRTESRNQLVLNLARKDVREYIFQTLDKLVSENDIAFLKWDYNRNWSEPGWPAVAPDEEKKVYVDYTENLYAILRDLRAKHPRLEIESCSGGGGRIDLGIMGLTDEFWTSDNTDPFDRLLIQDGFSHAYAPGAMMAWVTEGVNRFTQRVTSLDYRFLSSMQGSLGLGGNLSTWSPQDLATAKLYVQQYKRLRPIVQQGSLYRLVSPQKGSPYSVTESVLPDRTQAVLFAFLQTTVERASYPTVRLRGLDPERQYRLEPLNEAHAGGAPVSASGRYWMEKGITPALSGDYQAAAFTLTAVDR